MIPPTGNRIKGLPPQERPHPEVDALNADRRYLRNFIGNDVEESEYAACAVQRAGGGVSRP
jgi:hypothetical protein